MAYRLYMDGIVSTFQSQMSHQHRFLSLPSPLLTLTPSLWGPPLHGPCLSVQTTPGICPFNQTFKQICSLTQRQAQSVNVKNKSEKNVLQECGPEIEGEPRYGSEPEMWAEPQVTG